MTRIISGVARGRRLRVPSSGTRPTSDRVRESMFATIEHRLEGLAGSRVLDLYAGSGALGLEAASRGAARVVLVERDRAAAAVARANAAALDLPGVEVVVAAVEDHVRRSPEAFDVVLLDPPYDLPGAAVDGVLARLAEGWLAAGALVVVERATRGGRIAWPPRITGLRERTYGDTTLWYGQRAAEGEDP